MSVTINKRFKKALKSARKQLRVGDERTNAYNTLYLGRCESSSEEGRKNIVNAFFTILDNRQKCRKGGIDFQKYYYYIASDGRLAQVDRKNKHYLFHEKLVDPNTRKAYGVINGYGAMIIKHRRVIEELQIEKPNCNRRTFLDSGVKIVLENAFDIQEPCTMIIDTNFKDAYDPSYRESGTTDGDLASGGSCMSCRGDNAQDFYGGIEGCKVARFVTESGRDVGRCIVYEYEGKRHFVRIYGRFMYHRTMLNLVKDNLKEGDVFGRNKKLDGMVLKTNWDHGTSSMYLDGNFYSLGIDGNGKFCVVDHTITEIRNKYEMYDLDSTGDCTIGEVIDCDEPIAHCEQCGSRIYEDDDYAYIDSDNRYFCCGSCAERAGYRYCDNCHEWYYEEDGEAIPNDCRWWCHDCLRENYDKCKCCGEYIFDSDDRVFDDNNNVYCAECLRNGNVPDLCLDEENWKAIPRQVDMELNDGDKENE